MIHRLASSRGAARRKWRRIWPVLLAAAPLASRPAPALFGDDSPRSTARLPAIDSGARISTARGYLPLERWQASQAAAYPQAEAARPPIRAAAPTSAERPSVPAHAHVARKAVPRALNRPYLPLVRWQAAQAETQPYSVEQASP